MVRIPRNKFNPRNKFGIPDWRSNGFPSGFRLTNPIIQIHDDCIDLYVEFITTSVYPILVEVSCRRHTDDSEQHEQENASISAWIDNATGEPTGNPSIQCSILNLVPQISWDILWRIWFDNGKFRDYLWEDVTTLATKTYTDTDTLVPTRFLKENGNNASAGTSEGTAWATYDYALANTPSGGILQIDNGLYVSSGSLSPSSGDRNSPITIYAKNKNVGDGGVPLNNGNMVLVTPPDRTSPTGSGDANAGVWSLVNVDGPGLYGNSVQTYQLYRWQSSSLGAFLTFLTGTYRTERLEIPEKLIHHYRDAVSLSTPGHFAEFIYTNKRHRTGFWVDSNGDVYIRILPEIAPVDPLDPGMNPNNFYLTFCNINAFGVNFKNGAGSRVSGIHYVGFDRGVIANSTDNIIDHCLLSGNRLSIRNDGHYTFVAHCTLTGGGSSAATPDHRTADWGSVKLAAIMNDGTLYGSKVSGASEGTLSVNTGKGLVVEDCIFDRTFNGAGGNGASNATQRFYGFGTIIRRCVFDYIPDDCFEPEQAMMLWKIYDNVVRRSISALSTGPLHGGPVYFFRNRVWEMGPNWVGTQVDGTLSVNGKVFSKFSSESEPQATIHVLHNTFYTDVLTPGQAIGAIFAGDSAGGTTSSGSKVHERHHWYGNFIYCTYRIMDEVNEQNGSEWEEDYNYYFTLDDVTPSGIKVGGTHYQNSSVNTQMAKYRTRTRQGMHSNINPSNSATLEVNGSPSKTFFDAQLVNPTAVPTLSNNTLELDVASPLRNIVPPCSITARLGQSFYNVGHKPV